MLCSYESSLHNTYLVSSQICKLNLQVSHDEHLISESVEELWEVSEGRVAPFSGNFQDYKKLLKSQM